MSTERGIIEKIEEEFAWVRTKRRSACGGCTNRSHCSSLSGGNHMLVKVSNPVKAKKGDMVEVFLKTSLQLKCTFIVYMIPVLGLIAGALSAAPLANVFASSDSLGMVIFTFSGFFLSALLSRSLINRIAAGDRARPIIRRVFSYGN
jgi:sigma-E factor negative regulatory protein RseC